MSQLLVYRVLPTPTGGWSVHLDGERSPSSLHERKGDAVVLARVLAGHRHWVVVHDDKGDVPGWYPQWLH